MRAPCKQEGCKNPSHNEGYCVSHHRRLISGADVSAPFRTDGTPESRFWAKVSKTESCWVWDACKDRKGYGRVGSHLAHRVSYEYSNGPIPDGMMLDHMCHNHACVNPGHLHVATNALNSQNRVGANSLSRSGVRGVLWEPRYRKWRADASVNGRRYYLGAFATIPEAERVVVAFRREHMPYSIMDKKEAS